MSNIHPELFSYRDSRGNITRRKVRNIKDDGAYLHGFCEYSQGVRTFRKDRVIDVFTAETPAFLSIPIESASRKDKASVAHHSYTFEICFTGFDAVTRAELEGKARVAKMLVRSSVTIRLNFLCIGPNAGPKKLLKAEQQGVILITADEFSDFVDFGLVPASYEPLPPYVLRSATDGMYAVIDPDVYFSTWKIAIDRALWPAFGVIQVEQMRNGIKEKFYTLDESSPGVHEGDIFYIIPSVEGYQIIDVGERIEVMQFQRDPVRNAVGYVVDYPTFRALFRDGVSLPSSCRIQKNESASDFAKFHQYSE